MGERYFVSFQCKTNFEWIMCVVMEAWALFQYLIRLPIVRSRKVLNPQDLYLRIEFVMHLGSSDMIFETTNLAALRLNEMILRQHVLSDVEMRPWFVRTSQDVYHMYYNTTYIYSAITSDRKYITCPYKNAQTKSLMAWAQFAAEPQCKNSAWYPN